VLSTELVVYHPSASVSILFGHPQVMAEFYRQTTGRRTLVAESIPVLLQRRMLAGIFCKEPVHLLLR